MERRRPRHRMLLPEKMSEKVPAVGGVLARAVQQSAGTVRLHAFTFASNHFHLLVWARGQRSPVSCSICAPTSPGR